MIGNDVVDLRDAETGDGAQHAGFDRRVFRDAERARIAEAREPRRMRWSLWAAKEAAYKALRRDDHRFVFSPRQLEVELDDDGTGWVRTENDALALHVEADSEQVSALALRPNVARNAISQHRVPADRDRAALREIIGAELRCAALRRGLGADEVRLEREGRIPVLCVGRARLPVSIAHHGRFARAAVLWERAR